MLGRLFRVLSVVLFGWFVFVLGAVAYAMVRGRDSTTPEPDADEIDLVTTFGELKYQSTAQSFRGGQVTTWFAGGRSTSAAPASTRPAPPCGRRPPSVAATWWCPMTGASRPGSCRSSVA